MDKYEIVEDNDEMVYFHQDGEMLVQLIHDESTGDWCGYEQRKEYPQENWLLTKQDAINWALEHLGVLEDANYQRAPDRTSA